MAKRILKAGLLKSVAQETPLEPIQEDIFGTHTSKHLDKLIREGIDPHSALELIASLALETSSASKVKMEQIKMMDKLLNTARAMLETKLKNDEAANLALRINDLESRIAQLLEEQ
jgi:hypothetical protein